MKVTSYAVARPAFYDRNATASIISYRAIVAPHGSTVRCTKTISAGTKAYMEGSTVIIARVTAATTVGSADGYFRLTSGSDTMSVSLGQKFDNTLTTYTVATLLIPLTIYPGEVVDGLTSDASTGGTLYFDMAAKFTVFTS